MKIRVMIAVTAAKLAGYICKKMGRQGVTWAGKIALGICPDFTDAQTRAWYDANPDLFTRYAGDSFPYEEVKQIIEKRMREEVYDSLVQDLLRGPADRP